MTGKVYLVGAGPGDPGLITVKGLHCLQEADVVVYDRLVDKRLLDLARESAEFVSVGKGRGQREMEQGEINGYLVERALEGKVVSRLKGGDPFVFGRGGEEAQALAYAGVPYEVVPGVSSAIAAPAYAGIPITHRDLASSFTVVTGSEDPLKEGSGVRWDLLARAGGTLVVLMGWRALGTITEALVSGGMEPSTPVALVQWGTEPYQVTVTGSLTDIIERATRAGLSPPVVAVIGPVVDLRRELKWFEDRPLFGKRVLVTRSRRQASTLSRMLAEEGAQPEEVPTIEIAPLEDYSGLDGSIGALRGYGWVVFTSSNGVEAFFGRMAQFGRDTRIFGGVKVGAIGPATTEALERFGITPDLMPSEFVSEAVVSAMSDHEMNGVRVLLPRADIGRDELADGLARLGAHVDSTPAYRTVVPSQSKDRVHGLLQGGGVDVVTFTSSSTVVNLVNLLDGKLSPLDGVKVACIGPVTAGSAQELGLQVDIMAQEYTIPGLVSALKEYYFERRAHPVG